MTSYSTAKRRQQVLRVLRAAHAEGDVLKCSDVQHRLPVWTKGAVRAAVDHLVAHGRVLLTTHGYLELNPEHEGVVQQLELKTRVLEQLAAQSSNDIAALLLDVCDDLNMRSTA